MVGYQTSEIYGWVGSVSTAAKGRRRPNMLIDYFWPDTYNTYTWTHINFDPTGGLEYMTCDNVPGEATLDTQAVATGSNAAYNKVVENAVEQRVLAQHRRQGRHHGGPTVAEGHPPGPHRRRSRDAQPAPDLHPG